MMTELNCIMAYELNVITAAEFNQWNLAETAKQALHFQCLMQFKLTIRPAAKYLCMKTDLDFCYFKTFKDNNTQQ